MKTCRAAAKRFKKTGTGKLKRNKAYKSHILTKKSPKRKRNLRKAGKERAGNSGSEKRSRKIQGKNRSCFQGNKSGIGRKKHTNSGRATKK